MDKTSPYFTRSATKPVSSSATSSFETEDLKPPASKKKKSEIILPAISAAPSAIPVPKRRARLGDSFYQQDSPILAQSLLGKILVRRMAEGDEDLICGRIVETEAYRGVIDKAAHVFHSGRTDRTEAVFMKPGTIYVYLTYGMYHCMNISSSDEGGGVLLRAIEPLSGLERMAFLRQEKRKKSKQANR